MLKGPLPRLSRFYKILQPPEDLEIQIGYLIYIMKPTYKVSFARKKYFILKICLFVVQCTTHVMHIGSLDRSSDILHETYKGSIQCLKKSKFLKTCEHCLFICSARHMSCIYRQMPSVSSAILHETYIKSIHL